MLLITEIIAVVVPVADLGRNDALPVVAQKIFSCAIVCK